MYCTKNFKLVKSVSDSYGSPMSSFWVRSDIQNAFRMHSDIVPLKHDHRKKRTLCWDMRLGDCWLGIGDCLGVGEGDVRVVEYVTISFLPCSHTLTGSYPVLRKGMLPNRMWEGYLKKRWVYSPYCTFGGVVQPDNYCTYPYLWVVRLQGPVTIDPLCILTRYYTI